MIDWNLIRKKRNDLLLRSDWTQLIDTGLTQEQVQTWQDYRQQLRDITENFQDATDKKDIVWPEPPQ